MRLRPWRPGAYQGNRSADQYMRLPGPASARHHLVSPTGAQSLGLRRSAASQALAGLLHHLTPRPARGLRLPLVIGAGQGGHTGARIQVRP